METKQTGPEGNDVKTNERFFTTPLIIIFFTVFIDLVGFGIVIPILPFYAQSERFNASPLEIAAIIAIYSWMQFFFAPILGRLSDKYGRRPILFISILGSAVGYFIVGRAATLVMIFVGRAISGITGGNISTAQAYIADVTSKENRARGMGLFGAAFGLGFVLGPAMAGVLSTIGPNVPFYFAAGLSLANAAAVYFFLPESVKHVAISSGKGRFAEILESFSERWFGLVNLVYFLLIMAFSIMTYAFSLYAGFAFGYDAAHVGWLFFYVGVIAIVGQGVIFHRAAVRFGESALAAAGCLMMAVSLMMLPFIDSQSGGLAALLFASAILSLGNAVASPALTSLVSKLSHEHEQGKSLGIMQSTASLARAIGPSLGGFLLNSSTNRVDHFTVLRTFGTASAIMFVTFVAAVYFSRFMRNQVVV